MTGRREPSDPGWLGLALRFAVFIVLVLLATAAAHLLRDALNLQVTPDNEQMVHRMILMGALAYIALLAIPFVPGAEIGLAMITAFGSDIAPLVYVATVLALMLSYTLGCLLPNTAVARLLSRLRLHRAAALVWRAVPLSSEARLQLLLEGAPPRLLALALRHRYLALALALNIPGNVLIGGGGGIALIAGLSGIFSPLRMLITVAVGVSPVPLAVVLLGV